MNNSLHVNDFLTTLHRRNYLTLLLKLVLRNFLHTNSFYRLVVPFLLECFRITTMKKPKIRWWKLLTHQKMHSRFFWISYTELTFLLSQYLVQLNSSNWPKNTTSEIWKVFVKLFWSISWQSTIQHMIFTCSLTSTTVVKSLLPKRLSLLKGRIFLYFYFNFSL